MNQDKPIGFFASAPKREEKLVNLPSGRSIVVLETTGKQEGIFKDLAKEKPAKVVSRFLSEVSKNLDGVEGPIPASKFDDMLQWDRAAVLLHSRVLSHGSLVTYKINCEKCKNKSEHEIDIEPVLENIKPYPHGDQRVFSISLDGGTLHFELPNGETEKKVSDMPAVDHNKRLAAMKLWEETPQGRIPVRVENLRSRHIAALRKKIKELECDIDATVRLVCPTPGCEQRFEVGLVENPDFLFPNMT